MRVLSAPPRASKGASVLFTFLLSDYIYNTWSAKTKHSVGGKIISDFMGSLSNNTPNPSCRSFIIVVEQSISDVLHGFEIGDRLVLIVVFAVLLVTWESMSPK